MSLFSQRKGLKPLKKPIQLESMDEDLKARLWNAFDIHYLTLAKPHKDFGLLRNPEFDGLLVSFWDNFLKLPIDTLSDYRPANIDALRKWFFNAKWNDVYDFIEFVASEYKNQTTNKEFIDACNAILKEESAGYQTVGGRITEITSKAEIDEIERAQASPLDPMNSHFNRALELLSDRKNPDYRNSIKESILALESLFKILTGEPSSTLGEALKNLPSGIDVHPALLKAFSSLYGYTSTPEGIRHAMLDVDKIKSEDARYFLITCSAFANYMIQKANNSGFEFPRM